MKKILKNKWICSCSLVLSLLLSVFLLTDNVNAADDGSIVVSYTSIDEYYGIKAPSYSDATYKFAGWYEDEACTNAYVKESDGTLEKYYAKFVPKAVLTVKAQNEVGLFDVKLTDSTTGRIRFVTSVDSTNYKEVGFHVTGNIGTHKLDTDYAEKTVYSHLYIVGTENDKTEETYAKNEFDGASNYFVAHTFKIRFDQFKDGFTVTPYWITLDNVRVDGEAKTRSMLENLEYQTEANLDGIAYYKTLESAVNSVDANATSVITVHQEEIVLESAMTITGGKNITITNKDGVNVTIYRTALASFAKNNSIFAVGTSTSDTNNSLTIGDIPSKDSTKLGSIIIDGRTPDDAKNNRDNPISDSLKSYFYNYGTLKIGENVTVQHVKGVTGAVMYLNKGQGFIYGDFIKNVASTKGAVVASVSTTLTMDGALLDGNYSTGSDHGGAIYSTGSIVKMSNCSFEYNYKNYTNKHGGVAYIQSKKTNDSFIKNCSFSNNETKNGNGGVLFLHDMYIELSDCTFTSNYAKTNGGAIGTSGASQVTVLRCDFNSNSATSGLDIYATGTSSITYNSSCTFTNSDTMTALVSGASTASITLKDE